MAINRWAPQRFTLRQLQYLVAIADTASFRRAAELCRVAQPSLSAQIAELESSLGVQLFERSSKKVLITPAGADLVARARGLLAAALDLDQAASRATEPLHGPLRIGLIPTAAPYLLPAVVPELRAHFARATLLFTEDRTANLLRTLADGDCDAIVVAIEDARALEHAKLCVDPFVLAAPPRHRLSRSMRAVELDDLRVERFLLLQEDHCMRSQVLAFCSFAEEGELAFRAASLSTLAQMVASGVGVTLLPMMSVPLEAARAGLVIRPFVSPAPSRELVLAWRPRCPFARGLVKIAASMQHSLEALERAASELVMAQSTKTSKR
ncbi:MAG: LysR substrate-binding domain-containing protein [Polyangiaceae bacterium]